LGYVKNSYIRTENCQVIPDKYTQYQLHTFCTGFLENLQVFKYDIHIHHKHDFISKPEVILYIYINDSPKKAGYMLLSRLTTILSRNFILWQVSLETNPDTAKLITGKYPYTLS